MKHMEKLAAGFVALAAVACVILPAQAATKDVTGKPAISAQEARSIAQKTFPGEIVKEELENEDGGLRYSFDMRQGGKTQEVSIDAQTGRVLEAPNAAAQ